MLSCAGLIGAALTPQNRHAVLHGQFTLLAVGSFPIATALLAPVTALDGRFRRRVPIAWMLLTFVFTAWISVMPWRPTTDLELAIPVTLQKVVAITLLCVLILEGREAERVGVAAGGRAI